MQVSGRCTHPRGLSDAFGGLPIRVDRRLHLEVELRYHAATEVHDFVSRLLEQPGDEHLPAIAAGLQESDYHLRLTRDLAAAKKYLRQRYEGEPDKRFGLIASSRDKDLEAFDVPNGWHSTQRVEKGPWFGGPDDEPRSCRALRACVTEFGCQGLELDAVLLAWGTDFIVEHRPWSNRLAKRTNIRHQIKPLQLRSTPTEYCSREHVTQRSSSCHNDCPYST